MIVRSYDIRSTGLIYVATTVILIGSLPLVAQDAIYRAGFQNPLQGEITGYTRTEITIKRGNRAPEAIPANEVGRVRWDGEPAELNLRRADEEKGRLQPALEAYQAALSQAPAAATKLKADLTYLIARVHARLALADPSRGDEAIAKLQEFLKAQPHHFRYFEAQRFLGDVYLAKGDIDQATACFEKLREAPWNEYQMIAGNALARKALSGGEVAEAIAAYESVLALPFEKPGEKSEHYTALFGKAEGLVNQQKFSEALALLDEAIDQVPLDDEPLQAQMYLRRGSVFQAMGQPKQAVLAYLHVDLLFADSAAQHAEALYHLAGLWNAAGKPERAADAAARLRRQYPNSPWAQKLSAS